MGPPGGPDFGPGIAQAQQQQGKSPVETAVGTVEKILQSVDDESFRPYADKALATLRIGLAVASQSGPQSKPAGPPVGGMPMGPAKVPGPPTPGPMPA